jgi:hypothetical protein
MHLRLHANANTTSRTRAYIQQSIASNRALARELGIHRRTVARWKARQASPSPSGRKATAWSSASTAGSASISGACRKSAARRKPKGDGRGRESRWNFAAARVSLAGQLPWWRLGGVVAHLGAGGNPAPAWFVGSYG